MRNELAEDKPRIDHTPTPWTASFESGYVFGDEFIPGSTIESEQWTVAVVLGDASALSHGDNAAFIVKAVNCHDELVSIVQRLADGERSEAGHTALREAAKTALERLSNG